MNKKSFFSGVVIALVVLGVVAVSGLRKAVVSEPTEIFVPTGSSYEALMDTLRSAGVENMAMVEAIAQVRKLSEAVKPGRYVVPAGQSAKGLVDRLRAGNQTPINITFNNIRTLEQLSGRLAEQIEADSVTILNHLGDKDIAKGYGIEPEEMIGLFVPNTYQVWWNISPQALTDRMKREWEKFWNKERTEKLERTRLSAMEVMTLASIVYEESKIAEEMRKIAGVYINRLRRGIPLQACPTAKYAVGDFTITRVLHKHTQTPSPYNTYLHRGLPPGPICMPSIVAIDAVLDFEQHSYLYFCAREDFSGRHYFSRSLAEHNRYAKRYTDALNQARRR